MTCVVKGCGNYSAKTRKTEQSYIKYFTFPKDVESAEQWRKACGKNIVNFQSGKVYYLSIYSCIYYYRADSFLTFQTSIYGS